MTEPRTVHGWKAIASACGCSMRTARRWASQPYDPLPVRVSVAEPWAVVARLHAWQRRWATRIGGVPDPSLPRCSLREAIELVGKSRSTVLAYARSPVDPLPIQGLGTARPWAYEDAVRDWIDRQDRPFGSARTSKPVRVERERREATQRERKKGRTDQRSRPATTSLY